MIRETRGTAGEIGHRWHDIGGLLIILRLPHALGHPTIDGMSFQSDLLVKRVHGLVFHLPTTIATGHEVNHASLVSLIGIVIDADGIALGIEGDLLGITQTGVDQFEVGTIRLETEGRSLVRIMIGFAFLGRETQSAVTHRAVNHAIRT